MGDPASAMVLEKLGSIERRLDDALARLDLAIEHQKIGEEIQIETVKFFELTSGRQQMEMEGLRQAMAAAATTTQDAITSELDALRRMPNLLHQMAQGVVSALYPAIQGAKQAANLAVRDRAVSGPIRCVFLVHSIAMWDALADVYETMARDSRFYPIVISLHSRLLGMGGFGGEADVSQAFLRLGVPHLRFDMEDSFQGLAILKSLAPDVIFRQQQWDGDIAPGFATGELTFSRLCLVPYGTTIVQQFDTQADQSSLSQLGFDQEYHRVAWYVFCETEHSQAFFRSFRHSDPAKFVLSGYPKVDRLLEARGRGAWPIAEPHGRSFRIIWAPHHSVNERSLGFAVFASIYKAMLEWARQDRSIQFAFKPHPGLKNALATAGILTPQEYGQFLSEWCSLENCCACGEEYAELFDASDLLMTDGVSFLTEYQLFDKPLVFFDSGNHVAFNATGQMAEACAHKVRRFDEMQHVVRQYQRGAHWGFEAERAALKKLLRPNSRPAAAIILDTIAEGLGVAVDVPLYRAAAR